MHGVQSALAIKRQRKRRNDVARRNRRRATNKPVSEANLGGGHNTTSKIAGQVTTLHVGIIFSLIGFLFLVSAAIPSATTTRRELLNLVATGVSCLVIGSFLIFLNRFYGKKEDQELTDYVEAQLARTTSGQRLVRDQSELTVKGSSTRGSMRGSAKGSRRESPVVIDIPEMTEISERPSDETRDRNKDTYRVYDKERVEHF